VSAVSLPSEGGCHIVHIPEPLDGLGRERQRLAGGVADTLPGSDGVAGERFDQERES